MTFILAKERNLNASIAFRNYNKYLRENESRFPKGAYALASSDWWHDFNDHKCPHDAWLESAIFAESSFGERNEFRLITLTIRLFGAYHDGYIELIYSGVHAYKIDMSNAGQGHGGWRYDEFCVNEKGHLVHEIEWEIYGHKGSWLIECSDIDYRWIPI